MKNLLFIFLIIFVFTGCYNKQLKEIFIEKSQEQNVDYKIIMSICKHESGFKEYAINVNKSIFNIQKGPHFFDSWFSANLYMDTVLDPLFLSYDVGICQINNQHLDRFNIDNEDLLNIEDNIEIATKIYKFNINKCKNDVMCALSMYNTGTKNSEVGNKYAKKVLRIKSKMFKN